MSRILVIPDVHLKPYMFDMADGIPSSEYDRIVCLGDLVDDYGKTNNKDAYEETLIRALKFDNDHSEMLWCYGNHDISYLFGIPNVPGFSLWLMNMVAEYFMEMNQQCGKRLAVIHRIDDCLFSHAGLTLPFVEELDHKDDIDEIIDEINAMTSVKDINKLLPEESPIWFRILNSDGNKKRFINRINSFRSSDIHRWKSRY